MVQQMTVSSDRVILGDPTTTWPKAWQKAEPKARQETENCRNCSGASTAAGVILAMIPLPIKPDQNQRFRQFEQSHIA